MTKTKLETKKKPPTGGVYINDYVFDELLRELSNPTASLIYLYLWHESLGFDLKTAVKSHAAIGKALGLSKSTVQNGIRLLNAKGLLKSVQHKASEPPEHELLRPWLKDTKRAEKLGKGHKIDPRSRPYIEKMKTREQVFMDKLTPEAQKEWIKDFEVRMGFDKNPVDPETLRKLAIEKWIKLSQG